MRTFNFPLVNNFDEGDVLLKDGINGTKTILAADAIPSNSDLIQPGEINKYYTAEEKDLVATKTELSEAVFTGAFPESVRPYHLRDAIFNGKNMYIFDRTRLPLTDRGVTISYDFDTDEFVINGTSTAEDARTILPLVDVSTPHFTLKSGSTYTMSVTATGGTASSNVGINVDSSATFALYINVGTTVRTTHDLSTKTFAVDKAVRYTGFYIFNGTVFDDYRIKVQLEEDAYETDFVSAYNYELGHLVLPFSQPKYILDAAEIVANAVIRKPSNLNFAFQTDNHENDNPYRYGLMKTIDDYGILNFCVHGGDSTKWYLKTNGDMTKDYALSNVMSAMSALHTTKSPLLPVRGNHDTVVNMLDSTKFITEKEWSILALPRLNGIITIDADNPTGGYYYIDSYSAKIRVIVLNTSDIFGVDGNPINIATYVGMQQKQTDWLCNKAFNISDKADKADWGVLMIGHTPLTSVGHVPTLIANAFMNGTALTQSVTIGGVITVNITCDFATQGEMDYIGYIHGHQHEDTAAADGTTGQPAISTINASGNADVGEYEGRGAAGTVDYESFDIFSIDRAGRKIYATRFGCGVDREISY